MGECTMITVFTSPSLIDAYKAKSLLDDESIECTIANENVSFLAGEVPFAATWPQVDILNDEEYERAKEVLGSMAPSEVSGESWTCRACQEVHESQFELCWKCGESKG